MPLNSSCPDLSVHTAHAKLAMFYRLTAGRRACARYSPRTSDGSIARGDAVCSSPEGVEPHRLFSAVFEGGESRDPEWQRGNNNLFRSWLIGSGTNISNFRDLPADAADSVHGSRCLRCRGPMHTFHEAVHRLSQLRVHLVRDRHNVGQQNAEIQIMHVVLQRAKQCYLKYS